MSRQNARAVAATCEPSGTFGDMRLSHRLAAAALLASLPLLAACEKGPIGNTNNHITNGPPLPEVHPTPVTGVPSASASPSTTAS